jgi:hypothetical protein
MKKTNYNEIEIIKDRNNGMSIRKIMVKHNVKSNITVYAIINRNGRDKYIANKKYEVDENYFEKIDTEEKAYWLGFLYADGYVRMIKNRSGELKLKLKIGDKKHIELFRKCLKSNHKIIDLISKVKVNNKVYESKCATLSIYNTKIVNCLINQGCMNNKTFKIKLPKLDDLLMRHFIRGYFDGDGHIHKRKNNINQYQIGIMGNDDFIYSMQTYLSEVFDSDRINVNKKGKMKTIIISNLNDCKKIKKYFYDNSTIYLKRKKDIFDIIQ